MSKKLATPSNSETTPEWSVWREDDNGNVFLIQSQLNQADALRLAEEFERKGHKQRYWVEKLSR